MSEAYLIAAVKAEVSSFSIQTHAGQVRPALQELFSASGLPARRVQALHWHGGEDDFWLSALAPSSKAGKLQEPSLGFSPEAAFFQWPVMPLLAHTSLHSAARAIEDDDAGAVVLAQETGGQVVILLLASPAVVGVYNLSPRAVIRQKLVLSSASAGLVQAAWNALQKARPEDAAQEQEEAGSETTTGDDPAAGILWLAAAKRLEGLAAAGSPGGPFPGARWLQPGPNTAPGDLFFLLALLDCLEAQNAPRGLLLSEGPLKSGLGTLLERV